MDDCFYIEGREAYREGAPREDCPYAEGTDGEFGWLKGWDAAAREDTQ